MKTQPNQTKKLLCVLLTAMLLCSLLAGCGQSPAAASTAGSAAASSAPAASQEPASEPEPAAESYAVGTRTDTTFSSEWIGMQYTLPEGYVMATDEEIQDTMQIGADVMYDDKETGKKMVDIAKVAVMYEMMATSADGSNIIIMTEKTALPGMTASAYVLALKQQLASTELAPVIGEQSDLEIAGKEFKTLTATMEASGMSVSQLYCVAEQGGRMVCYVISYLEDAQKDALLSGFAAL